MRDAIGALIDRMEAGLAGLSNDARRHFHATYLRTTRAVAEEIERGGFVDGEWLERWDVAFADLYLDALAIAPPTFTDRLLRPANRASTRRFLAESRAKVWHNTVVLDLARRVSPERYRARLADLEALCVARLADLTRPGFVLLRLARRGFGVRLPDQVTGSR